MPQAGERDSSIRATPATPARAIARASSHATEVAHPGYYAVTLADSGVRAELTAGTRIGVHRYTFPRGQAAHLLLDLRTLALQLSGQGAVVGAAPAPRRHADRLSRNARLGAGAQALFRDALFGAADRSRLHRSRQGRAPTRASRRPGAAATRWPRSSARALEARLDFGVLDRAARSEGGAVGRRRRRRDRQSRRRAGRFRRRARAHPRRVGEGARRGRDRGAGADAHQRLHRALPRAAGAERVERCRRPLSRDRRPGPSGRGLHLPLDLFAVGHVPRRASAC